MPTRFPWRLAALLPALLAAACALPTVPDGARTPPAAPSAPSPADDAAAFAADIAAVPGRAAGLFHRYEFDEIRDAPAPDGYAPFYVAHYGRHGSRYQIDRRSFAAFDTLEAARKAGVLTEEGRRLLERLRPIVGEHEGMYGQLSLLGAEEHRLLARRMLARFPAVFARGGKVRCQSSTIQRCLASMANFACALQAGEPRLDISFATGDRHMRTILHPYLPSDGRKEWLARFDRDIVAAHVDPARLAAHAFADDPKTREVVPDPLRFAFDLFAAASSFESLTRELDGADLFDAFTPDELAGLALARSCIHYAHMGNAAEYGHCAAWSAHDLALDIARRADDAIASGDVCADLRFGHDSGLRPLAGLLGLAGSGDCSPAAESWRTCPTWKGMPMASNLQIVLYRKGGAAILAKVLFNERETAVDGLVPAAPGPYYRWDDLRRRLATPGGARSGRGLLALSFDGADPAACRAALPILDRTGARATFAVPEGGDAGLAEELRRAGQTVRTAAPQAFPADETLDAGATSLDGLLAAVRRAADGDRALALVARAPATPGEAPAWLSPVLVEARRRGVAVLGLDDLPGEAPAAP